MSKIEVNTVDVHNADLHLTLGASGENSSISKWC